MQIPKLILVILAFAGLCSVGCVRQIPYIEPPYQLQDSSGLHLERRVTRSMSLRVTRAYYVYEDSIGSWITHGPDLQFYVTGQKKSTFNWSHGKLEGKAEFWYQNGELQGETWYHDGVLDGQARSWYPDGRIESVKHWKMGKLDGPAESWDHKGNRIDSVLWQDNRKVPLSPGQ